MREMWKSIKGFEGVYMGIRNIIFRGKTESGKWVEGFYQFSEDKKIAKIGFYEKGIDRANNSFLYCAYTTDVIRESVGQFTGLYDKTGKKIFEGDIVKFEDKLYEVRRECDTPGGYWAETGYILDQIGWANYIHFTDTIDEWCNEMIVFVVGNIYDNPELLGE